MLKSNEMNYFFQFFWLFMIYDSGLLIFLVVSCISRRKVSADLTENTLTLFI